LARVFDVDAELIEWRWKLIAGTCCGRRGVVTQALLDLGVCCLRRDALMDLELGGNFWMAAGKLI
jgi:hypothetical protein